jgi:hypothetical protein
VPVTAAFPTVEVDVFAAASHVAPVVDPSKYEPNAAVCSWWNPSSRHDRAAVSVNPHPRIAKTARTAPAGAVAANW